MIFRTIVPKLGDAMYYLGKPVINDKGVRVGSITDVKEDEDHLEITIDIQYNVKEECK